MEAEGYVAGQFDLSYCLPGAVVGILPGFLVFAVFTGIFALYNRTRFTDIA